jgi:hypothetical protein
VLICYDAATHQVTAITAVVEVSGAGLQDTVNRLIAEAAGGGD